ncbi:unnamed protein product [Symbiodinium sp. CCMP2592]|nr:unnamed protein product [Symbiodinium sp. CCMP2592]
MRRLSICFIACLSRGVSGLDCSGIRDCGTCAVARQGFDQCGWCGTGSKGSCAKAGPAALGPKEGKCDRQCWFSGSIDAGKCPGSCEGSTCSECVASKNCMWCASTQTCGAKVGAFGDMCVGQKAVSCKSDQCAKSRDSEYCPKVSCSSLTKCNSCAQEPGCAWDAKNLKCVERARSSFIKACPSSDADEHCLISSSDKCPSTASGLCSEYKDDLKACLKANVPFSACRGGDVFSYFESYLTTTHHAARAVSSAVVLWEAWGIDQLLLTEDTPAQHFQTLLTSAITAASSLHVTIALKTPVVELAWPLLVNLVVSRATVMNGLSLAKCKNP